MNATADSFLAAIDQGADAEKSVVLRYRDALRLEPDDGQRELLNALFAETSLREGVRIVPVLEHRGVRIDVLDESSLMRTGTLKSIDGCVTIAHCLREGVRRVVFESGGNTGAALTTYADRAELETFCFVPAENLPVLDSRTFARPSAHLIAVEDPRRVKAVAARFAERHGARRVPEGTWRTQASTFLGAYLLEQMLEGRRYDHLVQSISAAFGPIGIYQVLRSVGDATPTLPRFIGIQQAANCPMVHAWRGDDAAGEGAAVESTGKLLNRVMYDGQPQTHGTFQPLKRILVETGGDLATVDHDAFYAWTERSLSGSDLLGHLAAAGIEITRRGGDVLEKAGLVALVGTLAQIEAGSIPGGSRVLVCLTGGTATPDGVAKPDHWVGTGGDDLDFVVGERP